MLSTKLAHIPPIPIKTGGQLINTIYNTRGVATCTHGRTCVPEKCRRKVTVDAHTHSKKKTQKIISEFTGKNDRTLFL